MDKIFEQAGRRMPYTMPEGFFDQLEQDVLAEVGARRRDSGKPDAGRRHTLRVVFRTLSAAAAVIALAFVVMKTRTGGPALAQDSFESVELAYNNLSAEDQDFLLEVYDEDVFLNEE